MQRLTISLDDDTAEALDAFMTNRGYDNRSEAMRDLLRAGLRDAAGERDPSLPCVAAVSYLYDHHERELGRRLTEAQHAHHDLGVTTLHLHLDHHQCVEVALLRGPAAQVRGFAEALVRERGVRLGGINVMPIPQAAAPPARRLARQKT
ncbi:nickel-responsive transcriptional regulator NikR [Sediminicoccus sp. KRV36]|uniref:nickel-responsive transcriptional regulator NikR n=1 Tax=Sediminicoccus sp. KRV36 TaxID=3133721 RepID=UPI00200E1700|nr:nickel-responsive transcriptional regulator NikR [Sediminicoccus rosea]UPY35627.1 nickel-responsive transcriptional regulator NikR [Sediminicoccus rosea]